MESDTCDTRATPQSPTPTQAAADNAAADSARAHREVLYVADPLCTWCWGFAPASRELAAAVEGHARLRVLPGGLSLDRTEPLREHEAKGMLAEWQRVHQTTGQPFDFDHPPDTETLFDSGPPCRALALMSQLHPALALAYLHALQHAFFAERHDLGAPATLCALAADCGADEATFATALAGDAANAAFRTDALLAKQLGLRAFPAVALRGANSYALLTVGYQPWAKLAPHVRKWLDNA